MAVGVKGLRTPTTATRPTAKIWTREAD